MRAEFLAARYLEMLDEGREAASAVRCTSSPTRTRCRSCSIARRARTAPGSWPPSSSTSSASATTTSPTDYSLSRLGMDRFRAWIVETYPEAADAMSDQPQAFLAAPAEAMHLFLAGLRERHGSVDDYVASLGVSRRRARRGAGEPAHARLTSLAVMDAPPYIDGHDCSPARRCSSPPQPAPASGSRPPSGASKKAHRS